MLPPPELEKIDDPELSVADLGEVAAALDETWIYMPEVGYLYKDGIFCGHVKGEPQFIRESFQLEHGPVVVPEAGDLYVGGYKSLCQGAINQENTELDPEVRKRVLIHIL